MHTRSQYSAVNKTALAEPKNISDYLKPKIRKTKPSFFNASIESQRHIEQVIRELGIDNMLPENYRSSKRDKPELVSIKRVNLLSRFDGRGAFSKVDIPKNTILGTYTGREFASAKEFEDYLEKEPTRNNDYAMAEVYRVVDAQVVGNFTRYINFSDNQNNVAFERSVSNGKATTIVVAIKDIPAGDQLLIDYNCYDERASKDYFFLNPNDGCKSAKELHQSYLNSYVSMTVQYPIPMFQLDVGDCIHVTEIGGAVMMNERLCLSNQSVSSDLINLPFLKSNPNGEIMDFTEVDSYTALMYAAYRGQLENVKSLVAAGAYIDQQQNHSGNCALFLALEGYKEFSECRETYLKIILFLISSQANVSAHDRDDRVFLHKASTILFISDFHAVILWIAKQKVPVPELLLYVDKDNYDPVLYCLANKDFGKATLLLDLYNDYFKENYTAKKGKELKIFNKDILQKIIATYNEEERIELLLLLDDFSIDLDSDLITELHLEADRPYIVRLS